MQAVDVSGSAFERQVIERSYERPVVVLFSSSLVPVVRLFEATLAQEASERSLELAGVDVERDPRLGARFGIRMVPAVKAFRRGRPVAGFVGVRRREAVARFLDSLLAPGELQGLADELRAEREWREVVAAIDEADYERALELLLARAEGSGSAQRERVRRLMLAIFAELGDDHPVSVRYRRRLAALLF